MSTQHTPGPWEIDGQYVQQSGNPDVGICEVLNMDEGGNKVWFRGSITEANARLIAVAPDLLEALRSIPQRYLDDMDAHTPKAAQMIRAAIAKAEGKS